METSNIIQKFVKEVAHFMSDKDAAIHLTKILRTKITIAQVRYARENMYIAIGQRKNVIKEKIGLDLYDHRLDKNQHDNIIKQRRKS